MINANAHTEFAPAERVEWERLYEQMVALNTISVLRDVLEAAPEKLLLLNAQRQIVYANLAALGALELEDVAELYGCRPGEVLRCIHVDQGEGGCGTSKLCRFCGVINGVLRSLEGFADVQRCKITRQDATPSLNLVVHSIPVRFAEMAMCLVILGDSASESLKQIAKNTFTIQRYAALIEQG